MSKITVLILAAGQGKRIKPIVTSKPMLPFCGKRLVDWLIADLKSIGFKDFVLVVNPQDKNEPFDYPTVIQPEFNGMAGAILAAKTKLTGPTVIVNGDDLVDPKILADFKQAIDKNPDKIILTGIKSNLPGGYFDLRGPSLKVIEKPQIKPSPWFKLVLDYLPEPQLLIHAIAHKKTAQDNLYEQALNTLLAQAILVKVKGYYQQLKYPWDILDMTKIFLTVRHQAKIHKTAKLMAGSQVINSYIGPHVVLGQHALVRDSIVEAGTTVGYHTEIARSYVGPNNNFHTNYVGDSIIEGGSNLGSGARLANMRFDKKDVLPGKNKFGAILAQGAQLGINSSVMPGVTLGAKALLGSGLVLYQSLSAGEFKKN